MTAIMKSSCTRVTACRVENKERVTAPVEELMRLKAQTRSLLLAYLCTVTVVHDSCEDTAEGMQVYAIPLDDTTPSRYFEAFCIFICSKNPFGSMQGHQNSIHGFACSGGVVRTG